MYNSWSNRILLKNELFPKTRHFIVRTMLHEKTKGCRWHDLQVQHELNDPSATGNHHAANVLGGNARTTVSITLLRQTKPLVPLLVPRLEERRHPETEQANSH